MIEISISNSMCQLKNLNSQELKNLDELLQYNDPSVEFAIYQKAKRISEINEILKSDRLKGARSGLQKERRSLLYMIQGLEKNLTIRMFDGEAFATGLLPRVLESLDYSESQYEIFDERIKPTLKTTKFVLKNPLPQLRYYQKEAAIELTTHDRGIVVMPTGTGKTMTLCRMVWDMGVKTLIITPGKGISDLMMDTLTEYFGKGKVEKLTTKTPELKKPINVVNIQALIKMDPKIFAEIDAVFVDEFHHAAASTYQEVNIKHLKNVYYRIGLTATNFRNDGSDIALESVLSKELYRYEIQQAFKDGFLVEPEFIFIENESGAGDSYQDEYKRFLVQNDDRNEIIAEIAEGHKDDSVLILIQQIEHGERLNELIPDSVFLHGKVKDGDRKKIMDDYRKGRLKCLIGTSVIGEGVDLPIANVLVMAGGGKAKSQIMQNIGRVLRIFLGKTKALVYDFADEGSNWLSEHSFMREEIYNEEY